MTWIQRPTWHPHSGVPSDVLVTAGHSGTSSQHRCLAQPSLAEVLQAEARTDDAGPPTEDVAEVERYIAATYRGQELIRTLPITQRLVLEVHRVLLACVRGENRLPGHLRRSPVWVGSPTDSPDTAAFVPPLPEHLGDLLGNGNGSSTNQAGCRSWCAAH